jgi:hypothetical protein
MDTGLTRHLSCSRVLALSSSPDVGLSPTLTLNVVDTILFQKLSPPLSSKSQLITAGTRQVTTFLKFNINTIAGRAGKFKKCGSNDGGTSLRAYGGGGDLSRGYKRQVWGKDSVKD